MSTTTSKSIDDAVSEARFLLGDTGTNPAGTAFPTRYTDAQIIAQLNTALREVYSLRPDAFIGNFSQGNLTDTPVPTYSTSDLGLTPATAFPLDDRLFFSPVVFYIAGRTELSDDEFTDNNRAMTLYGAFRNMLVGMPAK